MYYKNDRSLCYNLAAKIDMAEERFDYFNISFINKTLPTVDDNGKFYAYDIVLGKDNDTVAIVSIQQYTTDLPILDNGRLIHNKRRRVTEFMVAVNSLSKLGTTFDKVVLDGLEADWVAINSKHFSKECMCDAIYKVAVYLRTVMRGKQLLMELPI